MPRLSPRFLSFLIILAIVWTILSGDDSGREPRSRALLDLEKHATRPFGGDSEPPLSEKPRDVHRQTLNDVNEAAGTQKGKGEPTKGLPWNPKDIDLARPGPVLEPDPDWKPPPNESLPYKMPNGEEKLVKW